MNREHLESIRSDSCYPTFRGFVQVFAWLGYLGVAIFAFSGVATSRLGPTLIVIAIAIIAALLIRMGQEVSLMLADIADTVIAASAKVVRVAPTSQLSEPSVPTPKVRTDQEEMDRYGIAFDGKKYNYHGYRYDKLSDAISYASQHSNT